MSFCLIWFDYAVWSDVMWLCVDVMLYDVVYLGVV